MTSRHVLDSNTFGVHVLVLDTHRPLYFPLRYLV